MGSFRQGRDDEKSSIGVALLPASDSSTCGATPQPLQNSDNPFPAPSSVLSTSLIPRGGLSLRRECAQR